MHEYELDCMILNTWVSKSPDGLNRNGHDKHNGTTPTDRLD